MSKNGHADAGGPERVQGEPAPPDTKSWYEHLWKSRQETPARLEEAAKFLSGVISITLTLFLTVGKSSFEDVGLRGPAGAAAILWLLSLVLCLFVIFPFRYRYCGQSVQSIKDMHAKIVRTKYRLLRASVFQFLLALAILVYVFLARA